MTRIAYLALGSTTGTLILVAAVVALAAFALAVACKVEARPYRTRRQTIVAAVALLATVANRSFEAKLNARSAR